MDFANPLPQTIADSIQLNSMFVVLRRRRTENFAKGKQNSFSCNVQVQQHNRVKRKWKES